MCRKRAAQEAAQNADVLSDDDNEAVAQTATKSQTSRGRGHRLNAAANRRHSCLSQESFCAACLRANNSVSDVLSIREALDGPEPAVPPVHAHEDLLDMTKVPR